MMVLTVSGWVFQCLKHVKLDWRRKQRRQILGIFWCWEEVGGKCQLCLRCPEPDLHTYTHCSGAWLVDGCESPWWQVSVGQSHSPSPIPGTGNKCVFVRACVVHSDDHGHVCVLFIRFGGLQTCSCALLSSLPCIHNNTPGTCHWEVPAAANTHYKETVVMSLKRIRPPVTNLIHLHIGAAI